MKSTHLIPASKMAIAGAIAFLIYALFKTSMGFWSVVTIAAITQASSHGTVIKSIMRAGGTLIGALLGFIAAHLTHQNPYILIPAVFILITLTSFFALQKTIYSYAGIVAGMTIAIILFYSVIQSNVTDITIDRSLEILVGVFILLIINCVILFYQKQLGAEISNVANVFANSKKLTLSHQSLLPALKVSCATLLTFLIWYYFRLPEGYWAAITCLLIMEENTNVTLEKGFFRFSAHIIAIVLALLVTLSFTHINFLWKILPLTFAFFACGYLISTQTSYAGIGNTIGIAIAIMLLTSPNTHMMPHLIFARFYNVIIGISIAFAVLAIPIKSKTS